MKKPRLIEGKWPAHGCTGHTNVSVKINLKQNKESEKEEVGGEGEKKRKRNPLICYPQQLMCPLSTVFGLDAVGEFGLPATQSDHLFTTEICQKGLQCVLCASVCVRARACTNTWMEEDSF